MWMLPSLNRKNRCIETLNSIKQVGVSTPGFVLLGPNQQEDIPDIVKELPKYWFVVCQDPSDRHLGDVLNSFVKNYPDLPFYGYLQDDFIFKTPEWDTKLIEAAGTSFFASSNDLWQAPARMAGATCMGRDLVHTMGYLIPQGIEHMYFDDFWEFVGIHCKNWKVLMDVITEHTHVLAGKANDDETYHFGHSNYDKDYIAWGKFYDSQELKDIVNRVKELLKGEKQ